VDVINNEILANDKKLLKAWKKYEESGVITAVFPLMVGNPDYLRSETKRVKAKGNVKKNRITFAGVHLIDPTDSSNEINAHPFILDTGSTCTDLSSPNIKQLSLPKIGSKFVNNVKLDTYNARINFLGKEKIFEVTKHNRLFPSDANNCLAGLNFIKNYEINIRGPDKQVIIYNDDITCDCAGSCSTTACKCNAVPGKCTSYCGCSASVCTNNL